MKDYNAFNKVMYDLKVTPLAATNKAEADHDLIGETLLKLPTRIRNRIIDTVTFVAMGDTLGQTERLYCPPHTEPKTGWEIYLNFPGMRKWPKRKIMDCIAHECAHVILGKTFRNGGLNAEKGADDLIENWGFRRAYANYRQFGEPPKKKVS